MTRALIFLSLLLACSACDSTTTGTSGGGTGPSGSVTTTMTAQIDGQAWSAATSGISASNIAGVVTIVGAEAAGATSRTITLTVVGTTTGTYAIGPPPIVQPATNALLSAGSAQWAADTSRGSGSIVISSLNANGASGSFLFTATPIAGTSASGERVVSGGTFNVRF